MAYTLVSVNVKAVQRHSGHDGFFDEVQSVVSSVVL